MYVKVKNGSVDEYPYTIQQLRQDNLNVSFPKQISDEILASYGVYSVTTDDAPSHAERTQNVLRDTTPSLTDGSWKIGWTVSDKTADEVQLYDDDMADFNRRVRDSKLAETDYFALSDVIMSDSMQTYRQQLRDITTHANWPNLADNDWPTKP